MSAPRLERRVFVVEDQQPEWLIVQADDSVERVSGDLAFINGALVLEVLGHFETPCRSDPFPRVIRAWAPGSWKHVERITALGIG